MKQPWIPYPYLVPTGQTISFVDGDDGWYQAGRVMPDGVDRFKQIGAEGSRVWLDKLTGLTWADVRDLPTLNINGTDVTPSVDATFANAIAYANISTFAGRTGFNPAQSVKWNLQNAWRLPNIHEALSVWKFPRDWLPTYMWTSSSPSDVFPSSLAARVALFNNPQVHPVQVYSKTSNVTFTLVTGGRYTALE